MSVSNVSLNSGTALSAWQSTKHQTLQDFDQLFQAMQSGSLSGAQQAYALLQQLQPSTPAATTGSAAAATATSSVATTAATGTVATDWSSLGTALQSGSLSSAQSAFAKLQQDLTAAADPALNQAQAVYAAMQGTTPLSGASAVSTDLSALQQALQSGNTTSAQSLLAKLEQDLQGSGGAAFHHRHHHHGMGTQAAASAYSSGSTATASSPASSGSSAALNAAA